MFDAHLIPVHILYKIKRRPLSAHVETCNGTIWTSQSIDNPSIEHVDIAVFPHASPIDCTAFFHLFHTRCQALNIPFQLA